MKFLEGFHFEGSALLSLADTGGGGFAGGQGGHIGDAAFDGGFADVAVIFGAFFIVGGVDDQIDLTVGDSVQDIGAALLQFVDELRFDAGSFEDVVGAFGGNDLKAAVTELARHIHDLVFVAVIDADEDFAGEGKLDPGSFLRLVEGFAEVLGDAQHFAGGAHFRPENRIDLREHIEGEDCFFHTVVGNGLFRQFF